MESEKTVDRRYLDWIFEDQKRILKHLLHGRNERAARTELGVGGGRLFLPLLFRIKGEKDERSWFPGVTALAR